MKRIAIFASGSGSNAENIANYFKNNTEVEIVSILTNNKDAFVLERAKKLSIPSKVFNRDEFYNSESVLDYLKELEVDFIVLAGFLWLIPDYLLEAYSKEMVNVHPALLPNYGGKGMYGMKVHEAVKEANEPETGITIHYVNDRYDEGQIIYQAKVSLENTDTPDDIAQKVHALEYEHFPRVIAELLS